MTEYDLGKVVGDDGQQGEDGVGIASIEKTGSSGLVDTYTITYTDGDTDTFTVTNGSSATVDIVTSFSGTTSDSKVPSEKLTKNTIDGKLDNAMSSLSTLVAIENNDFPVIVDVSDSYKVKRAYKLNGFHIQDNTAHSNIGSYIGENQENINGLIDTALGNKVSKSSTTGLLKNDGTVDTTSYSTFSGSYTDLTNKPSIPSSSSDLSDGSSLVKTSSTTGLLKNDGTVDTNSYLTTGSASSTYQTKLVSGTSIKTINNESLLGSGNITIQGGSSVDIVTAWESTPSDSKVASEKLTKDSLDSKQATLVSGTNIKTVNNESLLGSGNITIQGGGGSGGSCVTDFYIDSNTDEWVIETSACSQGEVVTQWEQTLSDEKVPSEKLVKNYVDGLVGDAITYIVGSGN